MFATLLGALPRPPIADPRAAIEAAIRAQEDSGLEPITDGRLTGDDPEGAAASWRYAAGLTDRAVKAWLRGPAMLARPDGRKPAAEVERLRAAIVALIEAGCPLVEIEEAEPQIVGDEDAWRRLADAHAELLEGLTGTHLSLSITGGAAPEEGLAAILALPYASFALDLIAGPDNWNLAARAPGDAGIVAGVLAGRERLDESKEVMLWAAHYAASTGGRGLARVGLGSAGSWSHLPWDAAVRKLRLLGEAARLATLPPSEELTRALDPRAVSSRRAALGHDAPRPRRGSSRG